MCLTACMLCTYLNARIEEFATVVDYLCRAVDLTGMPAPFAAMRLTVWSLDWVNLEKLQPLLAAIRSGVVPTEIERIPGHSDWATVSPAVLRRALRLTRRGDYTQSLRRRLLRWARQERQAPVARLEMAAETLGRRFKLPGFGMGFASGGASNAPRGWDIRNVRCAVESGAERRLTAEHLQGLLGTA